MRLPIRDDIKGSEIAAAINELYDAMQWQDPTNNPSLGQIQPNPQYLRVGQLAYADGSTWNPGSGAGYYRYDGASWIKQLGPTDTIANATNATNADTVDSKHAADLVIGSQNVVTGSRAIGTTYQNTTGKLMLVKVSLRSSSAGVVTSGISDSSPTPATVVDYWYIPTATNEHSVFFPVLPSHYYKVTISAGTPTLIYWTEWY